MVLTFDHYLWNECWVHLNRSATLSKVLKKVKSLLNGSQIKFELNQAFGVRDIF